MEKPDPKLDLRSSSILAIIIVGIITFICCICLFGLILSKYNSMRNKVDFFGAEQVLLFSEQQYSEEFESYLENNFSYDELNDITTKEELAFIYFDYINDNSVGPTVSLPISGTPKPTETPNGKISFYISDGGYQFTIFNEALFQSIEKDQKGTGCVVFAFDNGVVLSIVTDKLGTDGVTCLPTGFTLPCTMSSATTTTKITPVMFGKEKTLLDESKLTCGDENSYLNPMNSSDAKVMKNESGNFLGYGITLLGDSDYADYLDSRNEILNIFQSIRTTDFDYNISL